MAEDPKGNGPHAAFGAWIREQRQRVRHRTQPRAVAEAKKAGLKLITQGKLSHLERGWNSNPDPAFLREVASLFRVSYDEIVERWVAHRFGTSQTAGSSIASQSRHHTTGSLLTGGGHGGDETTDRASTADADEFRRHVSEMESEADALDALDALATVEHDLRRVGAVVRRSRLALVSGRTTDPRLPASELARSRPTLHPKANRKTRGARK